MNRKETSSAHLLLYLRVLDHVEDGEEQHGAGGLAAGAEQVGQGPAIHGRLFVENRPTSP